MSKYSIGLIGNGLLSQHAKHHLADTYQMLPLTVESPFQQWTACSVIVYCSDVWSPRRLREINRRCLQTGVALLPVYTQFDEGVIGPCVLPHKQGCTSCAELRRSGAVSF